MVFRVLTQGPCESPVGSVKRTLVFDFECPFVNKAGRDAPFFIRMARAPHPELDGIGC